MSLNCAMKSQKIIFVVIGVMLVVTSIAIGVIIGLHGAGNDQIVVQQNFEPAFDPTNTAILPSREYVEARGREVRRVQAEIERRRTNID